MKTMNILIYWRIHNLSNSLIDGQLLEDNMKYAISKMKIRVICLSAEKPTLLKKEHGSFADETEMEIQRIIRILFNTGKFCYLIKNAKETYPESPLFLNFT